MQQKILRISAQNYKKWSNQQDKGTLLFYSALALNIGAISHKKCLSLVDLTTFFIFGQKFLQFFVAFLEKIYTEILF